MKKTILIIGIGIFLGGFTFAQSTEAISKKVAEGSSNSPFGKYTIEVQNEPVKIDGEQVTSYKITYENSPISVVVLVDKEENCKNYIVVSEGLSVMYTCNGVYFGVNRIDKKYSKDGFVTNDKNLNLTNYYHQKILVRGMQEEINATALVASFYPELLK